VIFTPLGTKQLRQIVSLQVADISRRLRDRDISLTIDDEALDLILKLAYDPVYGARPIKRYLEKHLVTFISKMLLGGQLLDHSQLRVSAVNNEFIFDINNSQGQKRGAATSLKVPAKDERKANFTTSVDDNEMDVEDEQQNI